ncbi:hypothetical protein CcCBS67573_g04857 [Chytriomyces confervae]|uniref:t-SNARE coiled-coil homology domain-containing protein n=1 Tax=Chytriomyces confervae TaxID=246404 RepID=A0A507FF08_9FUNG|nr:hypothetical protein CcCBS67573_g04857 [Chytriomyces confervae]
MAGEWDGQFALLSATIDDSFSTAVEMKAAANAGIETENYKKHLDANATALREGVSRLEKLLEREELARVRPKDELRRWEGQLLSLSKQIDRLDLMRPGKEETRDRDTARSEMAASNLLCLVFKLSAFVFRKQLLQSRQQRAALLSASASTSSSSGAAALLSNGGNQNENDTEALQTGELLQLHNRLIDDQDAHLDVLSNTLLRQKQIGIQIGEELEYHVDLLQQTTVAVDATQSRIGNVNQRLGHVTATSGTDMRANLIIIVLFIILVLIVFS